MIKFKWIVALSALFIAACAAFFSITGLGLLFAGATTAIIIMASSLEIGKLVAAAYLHRHWKATRKLVRFYMLLAVFVLMIITSGGIFGFLSNAYEQTSITRELTDSRISVLENRKNSLGDDFDRWNNRITTLTSQRTSQETRYDSLVAGEHWVNARRTFGLIESADNEIQDLNSKIDIRRDSIAKLDEAILNIKADNIGQEREIGGFRFIARAIDQPIDSIVKWFTLMLIFVFDPLAVALIIAWQSISLKKKGEDDYTKGIIDDTPKDKTTPSEDPEGAFQDFYEKQINMEPEIQKVVNENWDELLEKSPEIKEIRKTPTPSKKSEAKISEPKPITKKVIDTHPEPKRENEKPKDKFWLNPHYQWGKNINEWWNIPEAREYWSKFKT